LPTITPFRSLSRAAAGTVLFGINAFFSYLEAKTVRGFDNGKLQLKTDWTVRNVQSSGPKVTIVSLGNFEALVADHRSRGVAGTRIGLRNI